MRNRGLKLGKLYTLLTAVAVVLLVSFVSFSADQPSITVLYPKHNSIVGRRVNVVLDPATDWATAPYFQVIAGETEYPVVDTSTGRHAIQGIELPEGQNAISVRLLAPLGWKEKDLGKTNEKSKEQRSYRVVAVRSLVVFNKEGNFSSAPAPFAPNFFHTREHEADCSGCHRLDVQPQDEKHAQPDDVLCFTCHRDIPTGTYVHGPCAVWDCLACHNPDLYPAKYQFFSADPWKVSKTTRTVEPAVFTIPAGALFMPVTATLIVEDKIKSIEAKIKLIKKKKIKEKTGEEKDLEKEAGEEKEKLRELFKNVLEYIKLNPGDNIRIESHADNTPFTKEKGKKGKGFKNHQELTDARAKVIAGLLNNYGVAGKNRITSAGMGNKLPKAPNAAKEGRELNDRIEIVVHPPDVKIQNSLKLPSLKDRERVAVNVAYSRGAALKNIRVVEKLPKGVQYVKGSGMFKGAVRDPLIKGNDLIWQLGDAGADFQENLSFVIKKEKGPAATVSPLVKLMYMEGQKEESRELDPDKPAVSGLTVKETCMKCHMDILGGPFNHGPVDAGYCTLCHDPHASHNPAWLRKQAWMLCTTCHAEKTSEVHVVAGFASDVSHPTRKRRDPARPGKRLTCASCHAPHSAETKELLAYDVKSRFELCKVCHGKR